MQTAWFRFACPRGYAVLTTIGRRTGRTRRSCVRAVMTGDRAILVATGGRGCAWLVNLEAHPVVELHIGRSSRRGTARLAASDVARTLTREFADPVYNWDRLASVVNQRGLPTTARIRAMHQRWCREGLMALVDLEVISDLAEEAVDR
jgi:deazaflavin-dependent oxidoreductase (nitroreductase family)